MAKTADNSIGRGNFMKMGLGIFSLGLIPTEYRPGADSNLPYANGKYQTFPRLEVTIGGKKEQVVQDIDLGTLGPNVDTVFGLDFQGDIPTEALVVYQPSGKVEETRVIGIKRTDVETAQFNDALGGDRFDVYQMDKFGGNAALDAMARKHAQNTARTHQKVVYIGDLGGFEKAYGAQEKALLSRIIRAQRPAVPAAGIPEPNFVNPRTY